MQSDLILSNPPYIDPAGQLEASVAQWEDLGALFTKNCSLQIIEKIIEHRNFKNVKIEKDQFDRDRTAWAKL